MKKYLIKGLLALVAGGFTASCSDHDVDYVPIAQQKTQAYEKAFEEMIGGKVDANQNWGFEVQALPTEEDAAAARAMTRATTRTPASGSWEISSDYNATFNKAYYDEIVAALPEGRNAANKLNNYEFESRGLIEFSIIYSNTSASDKVGYYYYNPSQGIESRTEVQFVDNIQNFSYYMQFFNNGSWQNPSAQTGYQMWDWGATQVHAKTITINIPAGYLVGFYVINNSYKMYSNKALNSDGAYYSAVATLQDGTYAVGLEDWWNVYGESDFDCNDIVMAVQNTPTKPTIVNYSSTTTSTTTTTQTIKRKRLAAQGRVFCEDLGQAGQKDIDFNDIVFDARIWLTYEFDRTTVNGATTESDNRNIKYEAEICLLAAGGTIDAKLADRDLHSIFEPAAGKTSMVNTVDEHADELTYWDDSGVERTPVTFTYDMTSIIANAGYISLDLIPVEVMWTMDKNVEGSDYGTMKSVGVLNANLGEVPHKICLPIGTVWPSERRSIVETYPMFAIWATNRSQYTDFYDETKDDNRVNTDYLYTGVTTGLPLTDANGNEYYTINDANIYTNYTTDEILSSESYTVTETVTPIWEGGEDLSKNGDWGNQVSIGNSSTFDNVSAGSYLRFELTENAWWQFKIDAGNWNHTIGLVKQGDEDHGYAAKGYAEVLLTQDDLSNLSASNGVFIVHGQGCTITKVSIVTKTTN